MKGLLPIIVFLFAGQMLSAQSGYFHLHRDFQFELEKEMAEKDTLFHSSMRPLKFSDIRDTETFKKYNFFHEATAQSDSDFEFHYAPLIQSSLGYQWGGSQDFLSEYGAGIALNSGYKRFSLQGDFLFLRSQFPDYFLDYINRREVVPSFGYALESSGHYNTFITNFALNYEASKYFTFSVGQGRNFIGDGYRSLLLSDFGNSYPYAKIETQIWKIKYTNLFTNYKSVFGSDGRPGNFTNKYASTHYLEWQATKKLSLGFFESVLWQAGDTLIDRGFDVNYLNPVIFYRPVEFSTGSPDRVLVGLNVKYEPHKKVQLYGQMVLDEFLLREVRADVAQAVRPDSARQHGWWGNKYGFQAGFKYFDAFGLGGLSLQGEVNLVRPYTYSHGTVLQNYAHFGQPLAHPLESNFFEYLAFIRYDHDRFRVELQTMVALKGKDSHEGENFGGDLYKSYRTRPYSHGHYIGQGSPHWIVYQGIDINAPLNKKRNLEAFLHYGIRFVSTALSDEAMSFIRIGLRTSIYNRYYDF